MSKPVQKVCIVEGEISYSFDVVITLEYAHKIKIADQASDVKGKTHTNYAIEQPAQVSMEVVVADTVTAPNENLTKGKDYRSKAAFQRLKQIQKRRALLTLITPKDVYSKMMIESITVTENEEYQNEMRAQVVFKEMTVVPKKKNKKNPPPGGEDGTDGKGGDPSLIKDWAENASSWFGGLLDGLLGGGKKDQGSGAGNDNG